MAIAVPSPEARGVGISGSRVVGATVATNAAVFNRPERWGVRISGAELRTSGEIVEIPTVVVRLDTVDPDTITFLSPNETVFSVPWTSGGIRTGSSIRMCVQMVQFNPRKRLLGGEDCFLSDPV
jgi:hypothetical protein